jgi:hypothetical protein
MDITRVEATDGSVGVDMYRITTIEVCSPFNQCTLGSGLEASPISCSILK